MHNELKTLLKVYERTGRREIVLDVDLNWSSDCDVSVGFKGLGAPAVIAVREVFLRGIVRWVRPQGSHFIRC